MYASLGFTVDDVANFLQVSPRTVRLWISGRVRIPYAAYKLMRLQLRYELPGDAWNGWHLSAGRLYTPEGFELNPHDFSWWGLLVRQARCFRAQHSEAVTLRAQVLQHAASAIGLDAKRPAGGCAAAGLVTSINKVKTGVSLTTESQVNQGLTSGDITGSQWNHFDHKLTSCPTRSDSLPSLTQKPEHGLIALESASMLSSRLPSTRISAGNLLAFSPSSASLPRSSHPSPIPPRNAHQQRGLKALSRTGAPSTRIPTCGLTSTRSLPTASMTEWTTHSVLPLSLSTGQPASAQLEDKEGGAA